MQQAIWLFPETRAEQDEVDEISASLVQELRDQIPNALAALDQNQLVAAANVHVAALGPDGQEPSPADPAQLAAVWNALAPDVAELLAETGAEVYFWAEQGSIIIRLLVTMKVGCTASDC